MVIVRVTDFKTIALPIRSRYLEKHHDGGSQYSGNDDANFEAIQQSIDGCDWTSKVSLIRFTRASLTGFSIRRSITMAALNIQDATMQILKLFSKASMDAIGLLRFPSSGSLVPRLPASPSGEASWLSLCKHVILNSMSWDKKGQGRFLRNNSQLPEVLFWNCVKHDQLGFYFRRQYLFDQYILDFYCSEVRLNIEIDGKVHELKEDEDLKRDAHLRSKGLRVLRVPASRILKNPSYVAERVKVVMERMREDDKRDASSDGAAGKE